MRSIVLVTLSLLLLTGCAAGKRTVVERSVARVLSDKLKVDSVFLHDSVVLRERADTVFYTKYRTLYRERLVRDTLVRCDTVFCEKVVAVKEKQRGCGYWWLIPLLLLLLWKTGALEKMLSLFKKLLTKS